MPSTMPDLSRSRHHLLPENAGAPLRADLRKPEKTCWRLLGRAIERTRRLTELSVKQFAGRMHRDERQVRAWIAGEEQPQIAAVFAIEDFRQPFVIALAELSGGVETETVIRVRRAVR